MSNPTRLRNITVTLEEEVAQWARIEAARKNTSVSRLLGSLLKKQMASENAEVTEVVSRLANFGKRHKLSLGKINIKELINEKR